MSDSGDTASQKGVLLEWAEAKDNASSMCSSFIFNIMTVCSSMVYQAA
jgi:hypothetical protein